MPLYFPPQANPHPPAPPKEPELPPVELGRCRYCQSYTQHSAVLTSRMILVSVCPRKACHDDLVAECKETR